MIVNPHHELILLAAEMAQGTGLPSEFPEDRGFCKTTPVKERRRIIAELELSRQTARVWAQRVRAAADLLAAENAALRARLAEAEREQDTLLAMIRHQRDVLRECLPYLNESMAGRRPGRSADDIRAAVKALTTDKSKVSE